MYMDMEFSPLCDASTFRIREGKVTNNSQIATTRSDLTIPGIAGRTAKHGTLVALGLIGATGWTTVACRGRVEVYLMSQSGRLR
jgi:hypothetical protein